MTQDLIQRESWTISATLPVGFKIRTSPGIFDVANRDILELGGKGPGARRLVIVDKRICGFYLEGIRKYFQAHSIECQTLAIDADEKDKNLDSLIAVLKGMESFGLVRRSEPLIAVGGGALLDVVGMAAGMYRRGVPYIRVPTTLLAMVDASVGAKTGINFETRRNRLGSYYPPVGVYIDKTFLKTLGSREISSGFGEILKLALIKDRHLFSLLEDRGAEMLKKGIAECDTTDELISRSISGIKTELEVNLWEKDLKRLVDFGHSFSPALEMRSISDPRFSPLTHGQAVALDALLSSILSFSRGMLGEAELVRIARVARSLGLPTCHDLFLDPQANWESLEETKKHRNGNQHLPVPRSIGDAVFIDDLRFEELESAVRIMKRLGTELDGHRA